jgi:hypothetical protein
MTRDTTLGASLRSSRLVKDPETKRPFGRGGELYATGAALRDLLGEKEVSTFRNFAVTSC